MTKKATKVSNSPNVGTIIGSYINKKRIAQAAIARAIDIDPTTLAYYTKQPSIQSKTLWALSTVLKHNFFMDIALQLPDSFSTTINIYEAKDQEIESLKRRIEILEAEKAILLESRR